jgi:hypothetical protein
LTVDTEALARRADARLVEVLGTIENPGDLRDRINEYKQKIDAANAFIDSEKSREDVENAGAHHLPGLLLVKDRIGSADNMLAVRLVIMALGVELSRKPRITVMPYEQDQRVFTHVLNVLKTIAGNRLGREDLQKTLDEVKQDSQQSIVDSVKRALHNRAEERYAYCPY